LAYVTTILVPVTGANDGYAVVVVLEKNRQSHTLAEKTVDSRVKAETVAIR